MALLNKHFGQLLRETRQSAKLTQEDLAYASGLHRTYISLLERGLRNPTLESLFALCLALKENPGDFVMRLYRNIEVQSNNKMEER